MKKYSIDEIKLIDFGFQKIASSAADILYVMNQSGYEIDKQLLFESNVKLLKEYIERLFGIEEDEFIGTIYNNILPFLKTNNEHFAKHLAYCVAFEDLKKYYIECDENSYIEWL
jgi:hypothetical protein